MSSRVRSTLILSQAVLQYIDDLEGTYQAMFAWLRPGGFCSHSTGLGANNFSPFWNGHWAYTDFEWRMVRGRRECLLNRQPLSTHLRLARKVGFDVLRVDAQHDHGGLPVTALGSPFKTLAAEDLFRARRDVDSTQATDPSTLSYTAVADICCGWGGVSLCQSPGAAKAGDRVVSRRACRSAANGFPARCSSSMSSS